MVVSCSTFFFILMIFGHVTAIQTTQLPAFFSSVSGVTPPHSHLPVYKRPTRCIRKCQNKERLPFSQECNTVRFNKLWNATSESEFLSCVRATKQLRRQVDMYLKDMVVTKHRVRVTQRGIVFTTRAKQIGIVRASVAVIYLQHNSKLPSEVIVAPNDLPLCQKVFKDMPLTTCIGAKSRPPRSRFGWKHIALLESSFSDIIFLDTDNVVLKDPAFLFDLPEYEKSGAMLWPDMTGPSCNPEKVSVWSSGAPHSPLYDVFGLPWSPRRWEHSQEAESGQIVINKARHIRSILLSQFLTENGIAQQFAYGDKETFRYAFLALQVPFVFGDFPAFVGHLDGSTMVFNRCYLAHKWNGNPLFLHGGKNESHCQGLAQQLFFVDPANARPDGGFCVPENGNQWTLMPDDSNTIWNVRLCTEWLSIRRLWVQEVIRGKELASSFH